MKFASIDEALRRIRRGEMVLVADDEDRENEGDLTMAAEWVTPDAVNFMLRWARGLVCMPTAPEYLDRLEIPPMPGAGDRQGTAFHTSIDLAAGTGTGISAAERAATVRRLASADARPSDFLRPGHVFPLAARPGGLPERAGHTEATVELCRAAGLPTVGVICEVMSPTGAMAGSAELEQFALRWGLPMIDIGDLTTWL